MSVFKNIEVILMDVEGTTTSKDFVFKVLFPFSYEKLPQFLLQYKTDAKVQKLLAELSIELKLHSTISNNEAVKVLRNWIDEDKKHPILKSIQGMIWEEGYLSGALKSHVYEDVPVSMKKWKDSGMSLCIYSSGSVQAQKLLFHYCEKGNLTPLLTQYFDTQVGGKRVASSYAEIAKQLNASSSHILFLSDIEEELVAAKEAQYQVALINRDQSKHSGQFLDHVSFEDITLS